jgi:hypothetical protein
MTACVFYIFLLNAFAINIFKYMLANIDEMKGLIYDYKQ